MKYRTLRIAWSMICGLTAVLLIVLCVRSYKWRDVLGVTTRTVLITGDGELSIATAKANFGGRAKPGHFESRSSDLAPLLWNGKRTWSLYAIYGAALGTLLSYVVVKVPFLIAAIGLVGACPWLPRRFSLRTLLIVLTLVAVGLGLLTWFSAKRPATPAINHVDAPTF